MQWVRNDPYLMLQVISSDWAESLRVPSRTRQKPKMDIILMKSPNFDDIIAQERQGAPGPADSEVADELEGD